MNTKTSIFDKEVIAFNLASDDTIKKIRTNDAGHVSARDAGKIAANVNVLMQSKEQDHKIVDQVIEKMDAGMLKRSTATDDDGIKSCHTPKSFAALRVEVMINLAWSKKSKWYRDYNCSAMMEHLAKQSPNYLKKVFMADGKSLDPENADGTMVKLYGNGELTRNQLSDLRSDLSSRAAGDIKRQYERVAKQDPRYIAVKDAERAAQAGKVVPDREKFETKLDALRTTWDKMRDEAFAKRTSTKTIEEITDHLMALEHLLRRIKS
jgi:hypothetical protein